MGGHQLSGLISRLICALLIRLQNKLCVRKLVSHVFYSAVFEPPLVSAQSHHGDVFVSFRWYFALISVSGIFSVTFSVIFAYVADITKEHERSTAYGLVTTHCFS